jgi:argininosuccinate synthase
MKSPVVLAYGGGIHASAAIPWLIDTLGVEVVTVTLDVGQGDDVGELRARALSCGAVRAHITDARDALARDILLPSLFASRASTGSRLELARLPWPLIARTLVDIARIEGAAAVAHGSRDAACEADIHALDASLRVIAPAREWTMHGADLDTYARARRLPVQPSAAGCRIDQNLWGRLVTWDGDETPAAARAPARRVNEPSLVDIHFENGIPTSVNDVPMSPAELIECLALIGGQHGIGRAMVPASGAQHILCDTPAATVLQAAASASGGPMTADVCLKLADGRFTVVTESDRHSLLVNYA